MRGAAWACAQYTSFEWKGHTLNAVDTPGHADFGEREFCSAVCSAKFTLLGYFTLVRYRPSTSLRDPNPTWEPDDIHVLPPHTALLQAAALRRAVG